MFLLLSAKDDAAHSLAGHIDEELGRCDRRSALCASITKSNDIRRVAPAMIVARPNRFASSMVRSVHTVITGTLFNADGDTGLLRVVQVSRAGCHKTKFT